MLSVTLFRSGLFSIGHNVVYYHGREYYDGKINARMIMQTINQEKGLPLEPMILSRILNIVYYELSRIGMVPFAREFIEFVIERKVKLIDPIELCFETQLN